MTACSSTPSARADARVPPWFYTYQLHMKSSLSDADKATLKSWFMKDAAKKDAGKTKDEPAKLEPDKDAPKQ